MLRRNYEELASAAYGSHNADAPLPLTMPVMKTNPMQHYLEDEMVQRLGFDEDIFVSGSFNMLTSNSTSKPEEEKKMTIEAPFKQVQPPSLPSVPGGDEAEEEETKGLERGQI